MRLSLTWRQNSSTWLLSCCLRLPLPSKMYWFILKWVLGALPDLFSFLPSSWEHSECLRPIFMMVRGSKILAMRCSFSMFSTCPLSIIFWCWRPKNFELRPQLPASEFYSSEELPVSDFLLRLLRLPIDLREWLLYLSLLRNRSRALQLFL